MTPDEREVAGCELFGATEAPGDRGPALRRGGVQQAGEQGPGAQQHHGGPRTGLDEIVQSDPQVVIPGRKRQYHPDRPGVIGLPVAGCELKLVPAAGKLEARVRGPNITPGYYKRDDLTRAAFDEEGFYRIGDALKLADPADAARGIVFDGRIAEDFKLATGTWAHVGTLRMNLIAAADPLIQDAVITGHDRNEIGALIFLSAAAKDMVPQEIRKQLSEALKKLSKEPGSSMHPVRLMIMTEPPSIDANEITDKGYMNQRAVLERRAALVEQLYSGGEAVITA